MLFLGDSKSVYVRRKGATPAMTILTHGRLTLPQPHQSFFFSNWDLLDYQLTVDGQSDLVGYNMLVGSDETINAPLTNNGTLVVEDGSDLTIQNNLSGSGSIVANNSAVLIAGSAAASETIILMNNSQLYLGQPSLEWRQVLYGRNKSTIHISTIQLRLPAQSQV